MGKDSDVMKYTDFVGKFIRFAGHCYCEKTDFLKDIIDSWIRIKSRSFSEIKRETNELKAYWWDAYHSPDYQNFDQSFELFFKKLDKTRIIKLVGDPKYTSWSKAGYIVHDVVGEALGKEVDK